ncbi:unnamed protein product [Rotaria magnacalcarata]
MSLATARRIPPGLGQESVWDYPRPPPHTRRAKRLLETSHPSACYLPLEDFRLKEFFKPTSSGRTSY